MSARFQKGTAGGFYTLELTTLDPYSVINGELAPDYTGSYSHSSLFVLNDPTGFDPMVGNIGLDAPMAADANDNGFSDFFEVSLPISGTTYGRYTVPGVIANGTVRATWNRPADLARGTCVLNLQGFGDFTHTFDIMEFKGPISYIPGSPKVVVSMALPDTAWPQNSIGGELQFVKSAADPFNTLDLQPGSLTNWVPETLGFYEAPFDRDTTWPTNYYGYVELDDDTNSNTYYPYALYLLSIDDLNDADHDGIPDFSDTVSLPPPRRPVLALSFSGSTLSLTISGDVGRMHRIEQAGNLPPTVWNTVQTINLATDPQVVTVPLPQNSIAFWRVVAQ
jgi:hypothetical protein